MKTTYYLRKSLFCLLLLASFASISKADYPLFWQRYTADPWGNRIQWTTVPVLFA